MLLGCDSGETKAAVDGSNADRRGDDVFRSDEATVEQKLNAIKW